MGSVRGPAMRTVLVFSAVLSLSVSKYDFLQFAKQFGKQYASLEEFTRRQEIFLEKYQKMVEHNMRYTRGEESWSMKLTKYFDLTTEEVDKALGLTAMPQYPLSGSISVSSSTVMNHTRMEG